MSVLHGLVDNKDAIRLTSFHCEVLTPPRLVDQGQALPRDDRNPLVTATYEAAPGWAPPQEGTVTIHDPAGSAVVLTLTRARFNPVTQTLTAEWSL